MRARDWSKHLRTAIIKKFPYASKLVRDAIEEAFRAGWNAGRRSSGSVT